MGGRGLRARGKLVAEVERKAARKGSDGFGREADGEDGREQAAREAASGCDERVD